MFPTVRARDGAVAMIVVVMALMLFLAGMCTPDLADPVPARGFAS